MTVSVLSAAKRLAKRSGWALSNLQLQKIVYLAHMFHLGRNGSPLVSGQFEAWDYGPVHPDLYHRVKVFGADPVGNVFHSSPDIPDGSSEATILDEAFDALGSARPAQLVNATHRPGGAWDLNYVPRMRGRVIPNNDILREYQNLNGANANG